MDWTLRRTCVRMMLYSNDRGLAPVAATPGGRCRPGGAWGSASPGRRIAAIRVPAQGRAAGPLTLTTDFDASPRGRSDEHDQHADGGGSTCPQRYAVNHGFPKHRVLKHRVLKHRVLKHRVPGHEAGRPW